MSPDTIATIISVSIVVLAIAIIVTVIVSKIRHLSRTLFGTSSLIEGIQELGEQIFNLPTRIGYPDKVGGLKDVVNSPMYATAVGLLMYGAEKEGVEQRFRIRDENVFNRILGRMRKWFVDVK